MLSLKTQIQAVNFLQILIQGEEQVERARQHLAQIPSFEPYQAFRYLDRSSSGHISAKDLAVFMTLRNCGIADSEAETLVQELGDRDGIGYGEFITRILPWNNESLRRLAIDRQGLEHLGKEAEYAICLFFEKELDLIMRTKSAQNQMRENADFSIISWFQSMDLDEDGVVTDAEFRDFCGKVGVYLRDFDVKTAFQRLDKDRDGVISMTDLNSGFERGEAGLAFRPERSGSALLENRSISPYRTAYQSKAFLPISQRSMTPVPDSISNKKNRTKSPIPTPSTDVTPAKVTRLGSSRTGFNPSKKLVFDEDLEAANRVVLAYFKSVLALEDKQLKLRDDPGSRFSDGFRVFNRSGNEFITLKNFESGCNSLGLDVTIKECRTVFDRLDSNQEDRISVKDLETMVFGGVETGKKNRNQRFGPATGLLGDVLDGIFDLEKARKRAFGVKLCDLFEVFQGLDEDKDGFLCRKDLKKRLQMTSQTEETKGKFSFFDFLADISPPPLFRPILL